MRYATVLLLAVTVLPAQGDLPCLATPVSTGVFTGDTSSMTPSGVGCINSNSQDAWYTFVARGSGDVTCETCAGSSYDTTLTGFDGSCGTLNQIACNDDACGLRSRITMSVTAGAQYWVRVAGFSSSSGTYTLTICDGSTSVVAAMGDRPCVAQPLSTGVFTGNTLQNTPSGEGCINPNSQDAWYTFVATGSGVVTCETCVGSSYDTTLTGFDGSCGNLNQIVCSDDACGVRSRITMTVTEGIQYWVRVAGFSSSAGNYTLTVLDGEAGLLSALYQTNTPSAHLDHNGVAGSGFTPAVATVGSGEIVTAHVSTVLTGFPYEVLVDLAPQIPLGSPGAVGLVDGQVLNVNPLSPTSQFLFGGPVPFMQQGSSFALVFPAPQGPVLWSSQGIYLDVTSPTLVTLSAAGSVEVTDAEVLVEAVGTNSFNSETSSGFWRITNTGDGAITALTLDWAGSSNPGQSTMVFDTDQTGMMDRFDGGNSAQPDCLGTYRNGSDVAVGLYCSGGSPSLCDPTANTGWVGTDLTVANSFRTLAFTFEDDRFDTGTTFEFDCDTDGGAGITGSSMSGLVVTVVVGSLTLTGELQADPADPLRSFLLLGN